ncbi:MAG: 2-phosphosulfolactate phosphatase [Methanosphaera stadtmanae]|nr:2-phosphosulfolactate phosphatase [Methanosphaera stadtmanae]
MKVDVKLFNSETNDLAIVIDLLRASTTITMALNTFNKVIPTNSIENALKLKESEGAVLAGEIKGMKIDEFDLSNSPKEIQKFSGETLVLRTTNGTKVLENIKNRDKNVKILVGTAINAKAVAKKALKLASNNIELIMAGRHEKFTIEDMVGAGLIINELKNISDSENIKLDLSELAQVSYLISKDVKQASQLIETSHSANKLKSLGCSEDIEFCKLLNYSDIVPVYTNKHIIKLK